jgi:osmoprotectant transport system permease protein
MGEGPLIDWAWVTAHADLILAKLLQHVQLTAIAIFFGALISFPLGIFAYRHKWFYGPIAGFTGLLYSIPSLALFAFLVPYTGLSVTTAEVGLVSYTLLILIRNIVAGLQGVAPDAKEAARGMGYTDGQLLWRVELPLALPVIMAGVRLATVTTIGLVTVSALIGQGGLGFLIRMGFLLLDSTPMLVGAVLSMALAIVVDAMLIRVERSITPWTRGPALGSAG